MNGTCAKTMLRLLTISICTCTLIQLQFVYAATPNVDVLPKCGPPAGFSILFDAKGFFPNGSVSWRLLHSEGSETLGPFGSFSTDEKGEFKEFTYSEEQTPDKYTIHFFEDINGDFKPDRQGKEFATTIIMPCKESGP
jgi:hypothetical protein